MTRGHLKKKAKAKEAWAAFIASAYLWSLASRLETAWDQEAISDLLLHAKEVGHRDFADGVALFSAVVSALAVDDERRAQAVRVKEAGIKHMRGGKASHQQKRSLVYELRIGSTARSIAGYIRARGDGGLDVSQPADGAFEIVVRARDRKPYKRGTVMVEEGDPETLERDHVLLSERAYLTIGRDRSVIVVSPTRSGDLPFTVELVVLRDIGKECAASPLLYRWLECVVDQAVDERRDVRPYSEGKLVQVGINLGPRHARIIGWAKSFTRKLSEGEMAIHDSDVVGAASLMWAIVQGVLPAEVMQELEAIIEQEWMPRLATRNVPDGAGYVITIGDIKYDFSTAKRGPPTTYLSRGYSAKTHKDKSYFNWCISWTVSRVVDGATAEGLAGIKRSAAAAAGAPPDGGANFVDVTLGVIVKNAAATIMAFRPEHQHGTTRCCGAVNRGLTNSFDEKPGKALEELHAANRMWVVTGRGPGNGHGTDVDD